LQEEMNKIMMIINGNRGLLLIIFKYNQ
jgi:hypothetical protein